MRGLSTCRRAMTGRTPALTMLSLFLHQEGSAVSVHASPLSFQYIARGSKRPVFRSSLMLSRSASCSQAMRIFPALHFFALFDPGFSASISPHFVFFSLGAFISFDARKPNSKSLNPELTNFFCKRLDSNCLGLFRPWFL